VVHSLGNAQSEMRAHQKGVSRRNKSQGQRGMHEVTAASAAASLRSSDNACVLQSQISIAQNTRLRGHLQCHLKERRRINVHLAARNIAFA
jgi:hypothetical protein